MQEPRTFRLPQVRQHLCPVQFLILKVDVKQLGSDRHQIRQCTDRRVAELSPRAAFVAAPHCGPRRRHDHWLEVRELRGRRAAEYAAGGL